ncbi:hypothetical protein [Pseudomonas sp. EZ-C24]|uniref:hypothetical protein n=1 Tax=Pseudomonas sp. EZ-C24 TaxID=2753617 RepID=UPI00165E36B1|nr:hypothetical protein [Pseudomonas sp. EZ-C24]
MTIDKAKLKALAEAANAVTTDVNITMAVGADPVEVKAVQDYLQMAMPQAVLALLAEVERLASSRSKKERELEQELEVWRNGPSCWTCGDTGDVHDITGEWRGECDCLTAQLISGNQQRDQLKAENGALHKELEGKALVPVEPSDGLLMSMAIRSDHALGCPGYYDKKVLGRANSGVSHARMLECALGEMRKLHEEVVGTGFYSPEKDADYAAMAKGAVHG